MTKILALSVFAALLTNQAAAADPFAGKWKLNVRHSHYPAGACPTSMVIEIVETPSGIRYYSDTRYRNGTETHTTTPRSTMANRSSLWGSRGLILPVSLHRIDARTVEASYSRGLQVMASSRRTISADGKRMTVITMSKDESGKPVKTIGVYERD